MIANQQQLNELERRLSDYPVVAAGDEEVAAARCCRLALRAAESGCYGVGAVLLDGSGATLAEAHNQVFMDGFHSAAHAEMLVLDRFEAMYPGYSECQELTLMVSLEPCPMCQIRSLIAGIGRVLYVAADRGGGMSSRIGRLPAAWRNLASLQQRRRANVSPGLAVLAAELAEFNIGDLRSQLLSLIRPG